MMAFIDIGGDKPAIFGKAEGEFLGELLSLISNSRLSEIHGRVLPRGTKT